MCVLVDCTFEDCSAKQIQGPSHLKCTAGLVLVVLCTGTRKLMKIKTYALGLPVHWVAWRIFAALLKINNVIEMPGKYRRLGSTRTAFHSPLTLTTLLNRAFFSPAYKLVPARRTQTYSSTFCCYFVCVCVCQCKDTIQGWNGRQRMMMPRQDLNQCFVWTNLLAVWERSRVIRWRREWLNYSYSLSLTLSHPLQAAASKGKLIYSKIHRCFRQGL